MLVNQQFRKIAAPIFSGETQTFASVLVGALFKLYGPSVIEWDGITIELEIKDDLGVDIPRRVYDQMMGLINVYATEAVYTDVSVFHETVYALNRRGMGLRRGAPSVDEVAWAVAEIRMNDPEPPSLDRENPWSRNIAKYVRALLRDEGFTIAPKSLEFAQADKTLPTEGNEAQWYGAAWGEKQAKADEVDQVVETTAVRMVRDLVSLGIQLKESETESPQP
jgi:hypothetical protein